MGESHDPAVPPAYAEFMRTGWGDRELDLPAHPITPWARARRERLSEQFSGERLVVPVGGFKVRSNDCDYRFRAETAHTWLCGNQTSDAVLVIEGGEATLYARPRSSRDTDEFFRDRSYGELWAGRRPSLREISDSLGIRTRHLDELGEALGRAGKTRVLRGVDARVDSAVTGDEAADQEFAKVLAELRLVKDEWELGELQSACDITTLGFEDCVREWDDVLQHGERWIEGTFFRRARAMGNDIGYDSIVGGGSPRDDAALDREHRPGHARASCCCSTWVPRRRRCTPPTSPAPCRSAAGSRRSSATSTTSCSRPRPRASTPYARVSRSAARTTRRWTCSRTASTTSVCCRCPSTRRSPTTTRPTRAGLSTASATCSAWTCTTALAPTRTSTPAAT